MIGFFVGVIFFLITIPIRSAILILKTSTKTTEVVAFQRYRKRRKEEGKDASTATSEMKKKKKTRESMTKTELALYTTQKLLLRSLKFLLAMIQWIARLIMACSVLCWVVIGVFIVAIIGAIGAVMVTVMSDGFVISGGSNSGGGNLSGNENCVDGTKAYMEACQKVWDNWRAKGIDYSQTASNDEDYGNYRPDCSGYVYATLQEFGLFAKPNTGDVIFSTRDMGIAIMGTGKFEELDWTSKDALKAGDIVVQPSSHTQVYMGNDTWLNNGNNGHIANHDKPWNTGTEFIDKMNSMGGKVYRVKATVCETGDEDWGCPEGGLPIPLYIQYTYKEPIGGMSTIAKGGCGYTSLGMVLSYLKGESIEPNDIVAKVGDSFHCSSGMYWSALTEIPAMYGVSNVKQTSSADEVTEALKQGHPVICSQGPGLFTSAGHFIVLRGITKEGKILVNDPNDNDNKNYKAREFDMLSEVHSTSKAYWIFPKKGE